MQEIKEQISKLREEVAQVKALAVACSEGSADAAKKLSETHGIGSPEESKPFLAGLEAAFHVLQALDASVEKATDAMRLGAVKAADGEEAAKSIKDELTRLRALATAGRSVAEYLMDDDAEWRDFESHLAAGHPVEDHALYQAHLASGEENTYFKRMVEKYAPERKLIMRMG
jgi:FtsZ-binding cell division protein ZapB